MRAQNGRRIDRCNRTHLEGGLWTWDDSLMNKDVDMGLAGSLTMIVLVAATALLLRSFYKRYNRVINHKDDVEN